MSNLVEKPVSRSFPVEKPPKDPWEELKAKPGVKILSTARREP